MTKASSRAITAVATLASMSGAQPALAQDAAEKQLGTVHFSTSCNDLAQRRFDRAMRYQHSFWYRASKEIFEESLEADPECAIAYWGIALSLLFEPARPAAQGQSRRSASPHCRRANRSAPRRSASATISTRCWPSMPITTRFPMARACRRISRRWKRWRSAIPTTTKLRSATRSRSTSQRRPTTRPMPTSSRARRSWSRSSSASRAIPGSPTT